MFLTIVIIMILGVALFMLWRAKGIKTIWKAAASLVAVLGALLLISNTGTDARNKGRGPNGLNECGCTGNVVVEHKGWLRRATESTLPCGTALDQVAKRKRSRIVGCATA